MEFELMIKEDITCLKAGVSSVEQYIIVTNRPELVRFKATEATGGWMGERSHKMWTATVCIDQPFAATDVVVVVREWQFEHCGTSRGSSIDLVVHGTPPAHLHFGEAYQQWAFDVRDEALDYLSWFLQDKGPRVQRALRFAAGVAGHSSHAQRISAWKDILTMLGQTEGTLLSSVRTATAKVALRLGWKPSIQPPKFWAGLPPGLVKVELKWMDFVETTTPVVRGIPKAEEIFEKPTKVSRPGKSLNSGLPPIDKEISIA